MHRSDADDHSHVRLGDGGELGDLSGAAHRHLEHQRLGAGRRGEDLERQPDLGVVVGPRRDRPAVRREHRQQQVLGRGLAGRSGDPDHPRAQLPPPRGGKPVQRDQRVIGGEHHAARYLARGVRVLGGGEHSPGPGQERRGRVPATV